MREIEYIDKLLQRGIPRAPSVIPTPDPTPTDSLNPTPQHTPSVISP